MEEALTFELGRLAAADAGREPAPILVARLRESLHTRHGDDARRWPRAVSLGLAAALAVAVSLAALLAGRAVPPEDAPATTTAEFAPLVHGDALDDADALHLTRVRVPRSALPSLGWAGPMEDGPPVEAEVLVGQDGLARGIRFVASDGGVRR